MQDKCANSFKKVVQSRSLLSRASKNETTVAMIHMRKLIKKKKKNIEGIKRENIIIDIIYKKGYIKLFKMSIND